MITANVFLAPRDVMREVYFNDDTVHLVKHAFDRYEKVAVVTVEGVEADEGIAEEVFDLTNNPYRQAEREKLYGRHRSISMGDVIEVQGVKYLCESVGWTVI